MLDKELLEILACPKCKKGIRLAEKENELICDACHLAYRVEDGVPVLLINEAKPVK